MKYTMPNETDKPLVLTSIANFDFTKVPRIQQYFGKALPYPWASFFVWLIPWSFFLSCLWLAVLKLSFVLESEFLCILSGYKRWLVVVAQCAMVCLLTCKYYFKMVRVQTGKNSRTTQNLTGCLFVACCLLI